MSLFLSIHSRQKHHVILCFQTILGTSHDFYAESEIAVWGLNEDLLVIGHDTVGVTDPMVPFVDVLEGVDQVYPVKDHKYRN